MQHILKNNLIIHYLIQFRKIITQINMTHKTFISYKYSESLDLRDKIIEALGEDASYYQGETVDSPDMTDCKAETIKKHLTDMMFNTSVTIVIISPNIKQSKWIDWEIEYCLKKITRKGRTSQCNGIVAVIKKINGSYDWFKNKVTNADGCNTSTYNEDLVYDIIKNNRYNQTPSIYSCPICKSVNALSGSYISYVEQDEFLSNPHKYIDNAFDKSENDAAGYKIEPTR